MTNYRRHRNSISNFINAALLIIAVALFMLASAIEAKAETTIDINIAQELANMQAAALQEVVIEINIQEELARMQAEEEKAAKEAEEKAALEALMAAQIAQQAQLEVANTSSSLASAVAGRTPITKTLNCSAYCPCKKCCGKSDGITSSGEKARAYYTVAAGSGYAVGTIIFIPALQNDVNGGWFIVQDRGSKISNNYLDIFMDSHDEANLFGRRDLECQIYQF